MAKILESFKVNKDGLLEENYTLINMHGDCLKTVECEEFTLEREKELLTELRNTMSFMVNNYPSLCMNANNDLVRIMNGFGMTGMSIIYNFGVVGTLSVISSLQNMKAFVMKYKEIKKMEKFIYFLEYEDDFNKFNSHMGLVRSKVSNKVGKKISDMCISGKELDCNNILNFSNKELKKIKNVTNKLI